MKTGVSLLVLAIVGVVLAACGSAKDVAGTATTRPTATTPTGAVAASNASQSKALRGLRSDEDYDEGPADHGASSKSARSLAAEFGPYWDSDDAEIRNFGQAPSPADRRALVALTTRYLKVARAGDGARACALILPGLAAQIPEFYGRNPRPNYFSRGDIRGDTCTAVMTKLFRNYRARLSGRFVIAGVFVRGDQARVLVGSTTALAGYLQLWRRRGSWKVDALLTEPPV